MWTCVAFLKQVNQSYFIIFVAWISWGCQLGHSPTNPDSLGKEATNPEIATKCIFLFIVNTSILARSRFSLLSLIQSIPKRRSFQCFIFNMSLALLFFCLFQSFRPITFFPFKIRLNNILAFNQSKLQAKETLNKNIEC